MILNIIWRGMKPVDFQNSQPNGRSLLGVKYVTHIGATSHHLVYSDQIVHDNTSEEGNISRGFATPQFIGLIAPKKL